MEDACNRLGKHKRAFKLKLNERWSVLTDRENSPEKDLNKKDSKKKNLKKEPNK